MTACQLFGYSKSAVLSRNVKALIPDLIARNHNKALLNAEKKDVSYFSKRRSFYSYGRQMTGYIFPLSLNVKKVLSFSLEGDQYVALVTPIPYSIKSREMHMLVDNKLRITDLTETCFRLLGLKKDVVKKQKVRISVIIPEFPSQEKLEEMKEMEERRNQMSFVEEEMDVYTPFITEEVKDDIKSKMKMRSDNGSHEDDDSLLSALRRNEIIAQDSFYNNSVNANLDDIQDDNEFEDEEYYTINTYPESKTRCKVGISPVYIEGSVGYAVRITTIEENEDNSVAVLNQKAGKYQLHFYSRGNCFIRVPASEGMRREEDVLLPNR